MLLLIFFRRCSILNKLDKLILENIKVLYIEDENVTRAKVSNELQKFISHLCTASNGKDGIEKFYNYKPDVIITDLIMPDITGLELARILRSKGVECPIIITSALDDTKSILELVDLGIEKYIIKPINVQELKDAIIKIGKKYIFFQTEKYIENEGVLLDKEKQKQIESLFRIACTNYLKTLIGKGPRKIEVSISGRDIEIKAFDSLTQLEKNLLQYGYDHKMIDFNRHFLFNAAKDEIEEKFSEFCNLKMHLKRIEINSEMHYDKFEFVFNI